MSPCLPAPAMAGFLRGEALVESEAPKSSSSFLSACQEGRSYRLRRRAIDSVLLSSLVTGRVSRSWSALHWFHLHTIDKIGWKQNCGALPKQPPS